MVWKFHAPPQVEELGRLVEHIVHNMEVCVQNLQVSVWSPTAHLCAGLTVDSTILYSESPPPCLGRTNLAKLSSRITKCFIGVARLVLVFQGKRRSGRSKDTREKPGLALAGRALRCVGISGAPPAGPPPPPHHPLPRP